jgi:CRISPR-associated protein Csc1
VRAYHLTITLQDPLFFATRELGRTYITESFIHNYALTYALGLARSSYHDALHVPHYKDDLEPLNDEGVYVTPARAVHVVTGAHTFKFADTRYHVKMVQSSENIPGYGRTRELMPGSIFEAFVISESPRKLPRWIRLGKWMSKAEVIGTSVEIKETTGAYVVYHPLNPLDLPVEPLLYDLINMPPVSLVNNARFEGGAYILGSVAMPIGMRYSFL